LKKPKILLLDEATSALDKVNEKLITDSIEKYRKAHGGITIVVIAHRLSTIKDADNILVIKNGELTEQGNHDTLLSTYPEGVYASFCAKQASAEEESPVKEGNANEDGPADDAAVDPVEGKKLNLLKKKKTMKGDVIEVKLSPEEAEMFEECDDLDKKKADDVERVMKECMKDGIYARLDSYNTPKSYFWMAIMAVLVNGAAQPCFGGFIMSRLLVVLTAPPEFLMGAFPAARPEF
jgi:ABC-type multidrug transport system ATPase subunit